MKRRAWIAGGVALAGIGAGAGVALWRSTPRADDGAELAFWGLGFEQPGGGQLAMAPLRGQPLLVNFWATWCPPCLKEMPLLDGFYRAQQAQGWRVVGLALDSPAPVREYLARLPISFPIGLAGMAGVELAHSLGNDSGALPFTVIFDRQGQVFDRKLGAVHAAELDHWSRKLV
ncbi:MAG: TlpA family protein disulfide reductase [Betaproteobacteria bacterium]|nr:MAG: TlpA family protein disulfide reductase [Betaproteobacteria bacterium]